MRDFHLFLIINSSCINLIRFETSDAEGLIITGYRWNKSDEAFVEMLEEVNGCLGSKCSVDLHIFNWLVACLTSQNDS